MLHASQPFSLCTCFWLNLMAINNNYECVIVHSLSRSSVPLEFISVAMPMCLHQRHVSSLMTSLGNPRTVRQTLQGDGRSGKRCSDKIKSRPKPSYKSQMSPTGSTCAGNRGRGLQLHTCTKLNAHISVRSASTLGSWLAEA